jgi:hypothetical protein
METKGLDIPSCEAEVGTLMRGFPRSNAAILAMSTERPPPSPRIASGRLELILSSNDLTENIVASSTTYQASLKEKLPRDD